MKDKVAGVIEILGHLSKRDLVLLATHLKGLLNEDGKVDDIRREPFVKEGVLGVQESVPAAMPREERRLREYRFFRKAHEEWKEIESFMNEMAMNGWVLKDLTFIEGVRKHYWYFTWEREYAV